MSQTIEVKVPDIGDFKDVPVIEVQVQPGSVVKPEDSLITVESDKASFDVPSPAAGTVKELKVKVGDKVSQGSLVLVLEAGAEPAQKSDAKNPAPAAPAPAPTPAAANTIAAPLAQAAPAPAAAAAPGIIEVSVPDIGDFKDVPVIEVQVQPGSVVKPEDSLITLESDKASFDVPSPAAGTVKEVKVKVGDKVSQGSLVVILEAGADAAPQSDETKPAPPSAAAPAVSKSAPVPGMGPAGAPADTRPKEAPPQPMPMPSPGETAAELLGGHMPHASPVVRQFARELGVDLTKLTGSGPGERITREDVQAYVKKVLTAPAAPAAGGAGLNLLPWPKVNFAAIGPVEIKPLSRIKKIAGANLARNWVMIPHVTQFDQADITELEAFRVQLNTENDGFKLTLLAFMVKAVISALKKFPDFNASLDGDNLVLKQYYNIGFAADTPNGLMVPVIRDADKKSVLEIARESAALALKAREGKLPVTDMQGGCFTISSLGGVGGTAFTPIINAPEVAILGLSRSETRPKWNGKEFQPRLMLPLSLAYDHRVIDGAAAARFTTFLGQVLADMRRSLL